ncbi:hypothetical protein QAD02_006422 [Eretmocerus hayati]|uniref:Uncharacterized protein n=1 Tax=Eretmocerus hayati TaxID=131215 RepID=A0ACC2N0T5_9HYME|nr:hypothetical protein QAD02_006422 [Eretmocerus hayati]
MNFLTANILCAMITKINLTDLKSQIDESDGLHGPGVFVAYRYFKFVTSLAYNDPSKTRQENQFCLGSMITSKHILTTASCLDSKDLNRIVAYSGSRDLNLAYPYGIQSWIRYDPNQDGSDNQILNLEHNDIAIATVTGEVDTEFVKKRQFRWSWMDNLLSQHGIIVGWGHDDKQDTAVYKTKMDVKFLDSETCKRVTMWRSIENGRYFCTSGGRANALISSDYGGPLLMNSEKHSIIGLTIRRLTPSETGYNLDINIHVNVSNYRDFLQPYQLKNLDL